MSATQLLFTSVLYGITLRVLSFGGRLWLVGEDLAKVLEYRHADGIIRAFNRHKDELETLSIKARIDGKGHAVRLFDEAGVRYLCEYSKRPGAFHLLRWLDAGGMREDGAMSKVTASIAAECGAVLTPPPLGDSNVVALKALPSTPPACQVERRKAYCRELLKTLLRYTTEDEADELVHVIEDAVRDLLSRRHCPGLNDARYDVYRRFWLQGGAV
ncbi:hypothetical protein ACWJ7E_005954 [Pseudomonas aeruginosa]